MITIRFFLIGILCSQLVISVSHADNIDQSILLRSSDTIVTNQDLRQELLLLPEAEQTKLLASPDQLKKLLNQIYQGKRMIAEVEQLGLDQTPQGQARLASARRLALSDILREHVRQEVEPTDFTALAREHYATRRNEFQLPERFKAAHILKKVHCDCERNEKRQQIESARTRLQAGEDFATLAKAESEDTGTADKGGDLGDWFKGEQMAAPFTAALTKLNPGQISDIVETQFGFHIIKLLDRQPARLQSFEEVQPTIEQQLRKTYVQEQLRKRADSYLPGADAKYNDSALKALSHSP